MSCPLVQQPIFFLFENSYSFSEKEKMREGHIVLVNEFQKVFLEKKLILKQKVSPLCYISLDILRLWLLILCLMDTLSSIKKLITLTFHFKSFVKRSFKVKTWNLPASLNFLPYIRQRWNAVFSRLWWKPAFLLIFHVILNGLFYINSLLLRSRIFHVGCMKGLWLFCFMMLVSSLSAPPNQGSSGVWENGVV